MPEVRLALAAHSAATCAGRWPAGPGRPRTRLRPAAAVRDLADPQVLAVL